MKTSVRRPIVGWVFFGLSVALMLVQAVSMVQRGSRGESDVGVFYRTARLLSDGAGGEIYTQRDSVTGWPISIPPAGMAVFQPFAALGPTGSSVAWALFHLAVAVAAVLALRKIVEKPSFPWLAAMFLVLASGSVQVGQFSVLFVACWILAVAAAQRGASIQAALWAIPTAIKLYPLLLFAAPLSLRVDTRHTLRILAWFAASLAVLAFAVPFLFYGARTWDLNDGFFNEIVLDPSGRVKWMQALGTTANQSLDAVLIRYLSWYPKFHEEYAYIPTAKPDLDSVRMLGHFVRLAIICVTVIGVDKWRRRAHSQGSALDLLTMAALWSSTLYAVMPETRARYAVYAFIGFFPLVLLAQQRGWRWTVLTVVTFALVMGLIPKPLEVLGVGYLGVLALWMINLRQLGAAPRVPSAGAEHERASVLPSSADRPSSP